MRRHASISQTSICTWDVFVIKMYVAWSIAHLHRAFDTSDMVAASEAPEDMKGIGKKLEEIEGRAQ